MKTYGHHVLEVGLTLKYFLELMKTPDRTKLLGLFKMMMVQLKARNTRAKYTLELLRLLLQQYCLLPLKEAVLQACFVNTDSEVNSHVPADLRMEWLVKNVKTHLKHMFSNKNMAKIAAMSSALYGIQLISENFDETPKVVRRSQKYKKKDVGSDEVSMIADLHRLQPFKHSAGRKYEAFKRIPPSPVKWLDVEKFIKWFTGHKEKAS